MAHDTETLEVYARLPRFAGLVALALTASAVMALLWAVALASGSTLAWLVAILFSLVPLGGFAWVARKICRWQATIWLGPYLRSRPTRPRSDHPLDLCFLFVDHFEPSHGEAPPEQQMTRVSRWALAYEEAVRGHLDSDGRCPQHTWFVPVGETTPQALGLVDACAQRGWGEMEYHLHHDPGTDEDDLRSKILRDIRDLQTYGAVSSGRYGFVHGMFALSGGDGRYCRVTNEIAVLLETGCYADFTFPALGTPAQPVQVNSIYYAPVGGGGGSYKQGRVCQVGGRTDGLLIVQGPMCSGLFSRVFDDADVGRNSPPSRRRVARWLDAHVHVKGRPNWVIVGVHGHTATERNCDLLWKGAMQEIWRCLEERVRGSHARLHYVTAREVYNIIKAAEAGHDGNPTDYRDFAVPPPVNRSGMLGRPPGNSKRTLVTRPTERLNRDTQSRPRAGAAVRNKVLTQELDELAIQRLLDLNGFRVTADGVTFRSVHYHEVSARGLTMEFIRGHTVGRIITASGRPWASARLRRKAQEAAYLAGRWLSYFQRWPLTGPAATYDPRSCVGVAVDRVKFLSVLGLAATTSERLLARIRESSLESPSDLVATTHGDFKPDNLMIAGREIIGVDMETTARGNPLIDMGQFSSHLFLSRSTSLVGTGSLAWWSDLAERFLEGYSRDAVPDLAGLEFRVLDATLAAFAGMAQRSSKPAWTLWGRPLMNKTIEHLLVHPVTGKGSKQCVPK